jgi:cellulose synthase/poly-beta-1,6-N-acetylglucosamine synthase-like glycosyltransferase
MTICVIIPAYKAALTIERALASVAAQTLKPEKVIVVDDGSSDGTFEIAEAFKDQFHGIELKVLSQKNLGAGAARNRAIDEATGDWLAFLDADDEWLPDKLAISMEAIYKHNIVLVAHNYFAVNGSQKKLVVCNARYEAAANPYRGLYRKGFLATSSVVVRRDAVLEAGGFDETLATAQDFDLWLKILKKKNATFRVEPDALLNYFVTPGSITCHTARRLDCTLRVAIKHAPSLADLYFRICGVHYEAVCSALAKGQAIQALGFFVKLPFHLSRLAHKYTKTKKKAQTID